MISNPDIALLQKGDESEWDKAYPFLYRKAFAVSRNRLAKLSIEDSEDNATVAVSECQKQVSKCESWANLMSRVAIIAMRRAIDLIRKYDSEKRGSGKAGSLDEEGYEHIPDSNAQDLDKKYLLVELKEVLDEAYEGINVNERKCFVLRLFHNETHKEISEKTGIPTGSVGVNIKRAREKIRSSKAWKKFVENM